MKFEVKNKEAFLTNIEKYLISFHMIKYDKLPSLKTLEDYVNKFKQNNIVKEIS